MKGNTLRKGREGKNDKGSRRYAWKPSEIADFDPAKINIHEGIDIYVIFRKIEAMAKRIKLPRGAQARIARMCEVSAVTVCLVAKGERKHKAVSAAIERELARLKKLTTGAEAA
ncbi:MAG: hypothetical protein V1790_17460 [Planctomycetota bacterium]